NGDDVGLFIRVPPLGDPGGRPPGLPDPTGTDIRGADPATDELARGCGPTSAERTGGADDAVDAVDAAGASSPRGALDEGISDGAGVAVTLAVAAGALARSPSRRASPPTTS